MKSMLRCAVLLVAVQVAILVSNVGAYKGLACEGGELPLTCPSDTFINVTKAMYGRDDKNITCPHATAMANTNCESNRSLSTVQALCNGRTFCDVEAVSYYFGDPCNATYKYLRLEYECSPCVNKNGNDAECEMWALSGNCSGTNQTWMETNCAKACFKCESKIDPVRTNVLDDANCAKRATAGECKTNVAYMGAYCKKACLECPQATTCENKDNDTSCETWYNAGECTGNNSLWMMANCRKSCFRCNDSIKCENKNAKCEEWAQWGECTKNPLFMKAICTKSCLSCTSDPICTNEARDADCTYWANIGECVKNAVWMQKKCWKSCVQCTGPAECANTLDDGRCEVMAAMGQCATNYDYMISNCRLSCTRCKALDYGRSKCANANLNDTQCDAWAKAGECTRNSTYMMTNCYKSCTNCYKPYRIGSSVFPGQVLEDNAGQSVILPFSFSDASVITQFSAYFASVAPVYLQVWRPTIINTAVQVNKFDLFYSEIFVPTAANQSQAIIMKWCIAVKAGDRIGFTSMNGPAPIAYRMAPKATYYAMELRDAPLTGEFYTINAPFEYAFSADFYYGSTC